MDITKTDFKKIYRQFYSADTKQPVIVEVPIMRYIMIDGRGDPETSQDYVDAIQTLYPIAYAIKFMCKRELGEDFTVMPLECLWWADDPRDFSNFVKNNWQWTAMIMQPDIVSDEIFARAVEQVGRKKQLAALAECRLQSYVEGRAAQIMYIGPYNEENDTIQKLHSFIEDADGSLPLAGKHHEIYLSDPRHTAPNRLKTIIRQPF